MHIARPNMRSSHAASRSTTAHRHVRILTDEVGFGMYVAALDRPWTDTPFLMQGFVVDSEIELSTLHRYCRYVFVDLDRSRAEAVQGLQGRRLADPELDIDGETRPMEPRTFVDRILPGATATAHAADDAQATARDGSSAARSGLAPRAPSPGRSYTMRSDVRISRETRERFRRLVRGTPEREAAAPDENIAQRAFGRLKSLLGAGAAEPADAADNGPPTAGAVALAELAAALPSGGTLRSYPDSRPVVEEMPRARAALDECEQALGTLVGDIRSGRKADLRRVDAAVSNLVDSAAENPDALLWVVQFRTGRPRGEQLAIRVALYMIILGRHLGFPRESMRLLGLVGLLADIGKTRLPRALLDKPGMLNPAEYSIIKEHVRLGLEVLAQDTALPPAVATGIAQHHERLDGSGYPKGLGGDEIGLFGKIAAICDSFAALCAPRAYASPLAPQDALMNLYQWAGTSFHGALVERFVEAIGAFPVGSLVELSSGEVAVVLALNRTRRIEPRVLVLTWPDKKPLAVPIERDLLLQVREGQNKPLRIIRGLPPGAYGLRLRDYYAAAEEGPDAA